MHDQTPLGIHKQILELNFGSHEGRNKIFTTAAHRPDIDTVY